MGINQETLNRSWTKQHRMQCCYVPSDWIQKKNSMKKINLPAAPAEQAALRERKILMLCNRLENRSLDFCIHTLWATMRTTLQTAFFPPLCFSKTPLSFFLPQETLNRSSLLNLETTTAQEDLKGKNEKHR